MKESNGITVLKVLKQWLLGRNPRKPSKRNLDAHRLGFFFYMKTKAYKKSQKHCT
jgi:hypothetical protein